MSYILVEIDSGGYITSEEPAVWDARNRRKVVHRDTVDLDKVEGIRVFDTLSAVKSEWRGPSSDEAILSLTEEGQGESIWMAEEQSQTLTERLKIWSSCYGGWKVKKLNA